VIRVEYGEQGCVLCSDLADGTIAYVDRDWLPGQSGSVPALIYSERTLSWREEKPFAVPPTVDGDGAAAAVLLAVAREVADHVIAADAHVVEVHGSGAIATAVRSLVGNMASRASDSLDAAVDVTGEPARIIDLIRRLVPLGLLVLAGEPIESDLDLDVYEDVHRRGLHIVGVPVLSPRDGSAPWEDPPQGAAWERVRAGLSELRPRELIPADAEWLRLVGGGPTLQR
jgi:hypothetical protein